MQIMPFHVRRARKHFKEFLSKEQKCKGSAFQLLSDDTFQTGISPSGARGCQSSVHFAVKKGNTERGRVFAEVLSTRLWSAALKLSQQYQKQDFLYFLNSGNYGAEKGKHLQLTNLTESSAELFFPPFRLISLYDTER